MKTTRRDFLIQVCKGVTIGLGSGLITGREAWAFYNQLFHNKRVVRVTISANTLNFNLRTNLIAAGWNGSANLHNVIVTIKSGVYVYSDDVGQYAFDSGSLPAGTVVTLRNNGFIIGKGGAGGGYNMPNDIDGQDGGAAMNITRKFIIDNQNGYIAGGGGGGAGAKSTASYYALGGGGGAGGGDGGDTYDNNNFTTQTGGAGGASGSSGSDGSGVSAYGAAPGGGGGRIVPGATLAGPTYSSTVGVVGQGNSGGGTGGIRTSASNSPYSGAGTTGGSGGAAGVVGGNGVLGSYSGSTYRVGAGGGGGGWGAAGGNAVYVGASQTPTLGTPGSGGKAINLNGNTVTWVGGAASSGRAYGAVS